MENKIWIDSLIKQKLKIDWLFKKIKKKLFSKFAKLILRIMKQIKLKIKTVQFFFFLLKNNNFSVIGNIFYWKIMNFDLF